MHTEDTLLEDLFTAYYDARRNKRNTKAQLQFELNLESSLIALYKELKKRTYSPSKSVCFIVNKPVKREIFASDFRDRVVHHLVFNYVSPIMEKYFIYDSYSCRKGKGTMFGVKRLEHHIRSCTQNYRQDAYILKLDLKGYFMSINKERLFKLIMEKLDRNNIAGDKDLLIFLLNQLIFKEATDGCERRSSLGEWDGLPPSKSMFHSKKGVGLPIGDLTSQLFSNIYLHELDMYVKRRLKIKHYGRYVDDFYLVHPDKEYLKTLIVQLKEYLLMELDLTLHPHKIYLQHYSKGVEYLGVILKPYRKYAGCRTVRQFRQAVSRVEKDCRKKTLPDKERAEIRSVINSYCGYLKHYKSFNILKKQFYTSPLFKHYCFSGGYRKLIELKCNKPNNN